MMVFNVVGDKSDVCGGVFDKQAVLVFCHKAVQITRLIKPAIIYV